MAECNILVSIGLSISSRLRVQYLKGGYLDKKCYMYTIHEDCHHHGSSSSLTSAFIGAPTWHQSQLRTFDGDGLLFLVLRSSSSRLLSAPACHRGNSVQVPKLFRVSTNIDALGYFTLFLLVVLLRWRARQSLRKLW